MQLLLRLGIDLVSILILIRFIYYPHYKNRDLFFTYFIFNIIIFFITFLLNKTEISIGAAFGLFAVFSMLRYRTEGISIKDMTYLFLVIALGLITSINYGPIYFTAFLNALILLLTFLLESNFLIKREFVKSIQYDNIELIKPDKKTELITDIENRTGLKINRITVGDIDFLKDTATIKIYYYETK